jgi:hypothetical protein
MDPYYYLDPEEGDDWTPNRYEVPSMFSRVSDLRSPSKDEALAPNVDMPSQHQTSKHSVGLSTSTGFRPVFSAHRDVEQRPVMTSLSPQPASNGTGRLRRSTRLGDSAPSYTAYFKPVEAFDEGSEGDESASRVAKVRTRRTGGSGRVPSSRHVSSSPSDIYTEPEAYTVVGSVGGSRSAMTGNFSIQSHMSGFVSLASNNPVRTNRPALFSRDERFFVENPTGWCQVAFTARSGVKTGEEWQGLRSRLTDCMRAIERDDRQRALTGQVYTHCQTVLALLSESKDFRTMTDTNFSAAINRSLLRLKDAHLVSRNSASKRAFSAEQETVKWLQSCLSALLQSHQLAECKRQDGSDPIWPDYVKVADIVYLGENKPAGLSSQ